MFTKIAQIARNLDENGYYEEADIITNLLKLAATEDQNNLKFAQQALSGYVNQFQNYGKPQNIPNIPLKTPKTSIQVKSPVKTPYYKNLTKQQTPNVPPVIPQPKPSLLNRANNAVKNGIINSTEYIGNKAGKAWNQAGQDLKEVPGELWDGAKDLGQQGLDAINQELLQVPGYEERAKEVKQFRDIMGL